MVAERLVDEPFAAADEDQRVLGVVEGLVGELHRVVERDVGEHEVAVDPGVVLAERGARLLVRAGGPWPLLVGLERSGISGAFGWIRLLGELRVTLVAPARQQRGCSRRGGDVRRWPFCDLHAADDAVVDDQPLGGRPEHGISPPASVTACRARPDVGGRVDPVTAAVPQDRDLVVDRGQPERADPRHGIGETRGRQDVAECWVAVGVSLGENGLPTMRSRGEQA